MSYYFAWKPYVPVAERRRRAEQKLKKMRKKGDAVAPVNIDGRKIARSFWGQAWCTNLESYSDYENRLPRGRSYVRNGSVLDLQIAQGEVTAMVAGSELYRVNISIAPVVTARWKSICHDCAGSIDSLVELLQGRVAKGVMDRVCRKDDGLFPAPREIELSCSCPDWADMCKHVAAAMYGVGARLDQKPELLFVLRGVDQTDLLAVAGPETALRKEGSAAKVLGDDDMAALFGLEMAEAGDTQVADTRHGPSKVVDIEGTKPKRAKVRDAKPGAVKSNRSKPNAANSVSPVAITAEVTPVSETSIKKVAKSKRSKSDRLGGKGVKDTALRYLAAEGAASKQGRVKSTAAKVGATRPSLETAQKTNVLAISPKLKKTSQTPAAVPKARTRRVLKIFA